MNIELLPSKLDIPTLQVELGNKKVMLHSKYDPIQEAERFIESQHEKIEHAEHIIFYGVGLGYFLQAFIEKFPEKLVSVYEPFLQIAQLCVNQKNTTQIQLEELEHFLVEDPQQPIEQSLQLLREIVYQKFVIITPPVYERLFPEKVKKFNEAFKNFLLLTGNDISTISEFSMRWTINAIKNFKETLNSQSIFEKKKYFKGKPVILVSAGPSLTEELENLRAIKEQGLAYIFAVGSANKTLIKNVIIPDAVCTYDPQQHNYKLFEEIYNRNIDNIPMIYATTVGYETLEFYTGPKFYFNTSQDHFTQELLSKLQCPIIYDASSIAVIILQVLNVLQVSKVILVGQNFAFKQGKFYAEGIDRFDKEKSTLSDNKVQMKDEKTVIEVIDVNGHKVKTNLHFLQMKSDMETAIQMLNLHVINTTKDGARIEGAPFKNLSKLLKTELNKKVVYQEWGKVERKQKINIQKLNSIRNESIHFIEQYEKLKETLRSIKQQEDFTEVVNALKEYSDKMRLIQDNAFFELFLSNPLKIPNEKLNASIKVSNKTKVKTEMISSIVNIHEIYLQELEEAFKQINSILHNSLFLQRYS
ncbi:motility associated factor glycosyltransferase family protein [Lysinibacillus sp. NPDC097231]|uniref:motility associated factor glycosyltransferase family protein n=1 Tax=Lysinibacillus sp. NPDC097231 TaxID=3364142 RepID=UPI003820081B